MERFYLNKPSEPHLSLKTTWVELQFFDRDSILFKRNPGNIVELNDL